MLVNDNKYEGVKDVISWSKSSGYLDDSFKDGDDFCRKILKSLMKKLHEITSKMPTHDGGIHSENDNMTNVVVIRCPYNIDVVTELLFIIFL